MIKRDLEWKKVIMKPFFSILWVKLNEKHNIHK